MLGKLFFSDHTLTGLRLCLIGSETRKHWLFRLDGFGFLGFAVTASLAFGHIMILTVLREVLPRLGSTMEVYQSLSSFKLDITSQSNKFSVFAIKISQPPAKLIARLADEKAALPNA
jgi:hypothetical protein